MAFVSSTPSEAVDFKIGASQRLPTGHVAKQVTWIEKPLTTYKASDRAIAKKLTATWDFSGTNCSYMQRCPAVWVYVMAT